MTTSQKEQGKRASIMGKFPYPSRSDKILIISRLQKVVLYCNLQINTKSSHKEKYLKVQQIRQNRALKNTQVIQKAGMGKKNNVY